MVKLIEALWGFVLALSCRWNVAIELICRIGGHVMCGHGIYGIPEKLDALLLCLKHHRHLHLPFLESLLFIFFTSR